MWFKHENVFSHSSSPEVQVVMHQSDAGLVTSTAPPLLVTFSVFPWPPLG